MATTTILSSLWLVQGFMFSPARARPLCLRGRTCLTHTPCVAVCSRADRWAGALCAAWRASTQRVRSRAGVPRRAPARVRARCCDILGTGTVFWSGGSAQGYGGTSWGQLSGNRVRNGGNALAMDQWKQVG